MRKGVIRTIDTVGRISLPIEYRQLLTIAEGGAVEISDHSGRIELKAIESACVFCHSQEQLLPFKNRLVCQPCVDEIPAPVSV
jgi:AbrB family transcriptional regulator, transcriptional pleiotropic regulator of transition state genes